MKKLYLYAIAALATICAFFINPMLLRAQPSGIPAEIPVSYDVSATGSFQYSVPLRIPPGIKDMMPNLAITYNSQSGNSNLGIGWSLTGLSAITRGMPDLYHHHNIQPLGINTGDVLYLDGQELIFSGSVYLTEVKNFAKIQSFGTAGSGPSYFIVEYPNGLTYEYGNTTSSKMLAQGKSEVLMWTVSKIEDPYGNYIEFEYDNQQSTGEYKVTRIVYAAHSTSGTTNPVEINFSYMARQDINAAWAAGARISLNELLEDIIIKFSNGTIANKYHLTYDMTDLAKLTKIEEIPDAANSMPPINITWGSSSEPISQQPITLSSGIIDRIPGDFNGDGFFDIIEQDGTDCYVYINDGTGNFTQVTGANVPPVFNWGPHSKFGPRGIRRQKGGVKPSMYFDYDGDGLDDVIVIQMYNKGVAIQVPSLQQVPVPTPYYQVWLYRANGNPVTIFDAGVKLYEKVSNGVNSKNDNFNSLTHFQAGDFDGDGKTELFIAHPYNFDNLNSVADYEFFVIGDEYGAHQVYHFGHGHIDGTLVLDYNGDGRDEFVATHKLLGTTPTSFLYGLKLTYDATTLKPQLVQTPTQWPLHLFSNSSVLHTYAQHFTGDFNGDGMDDVLVYHVNNSDWTLVYSNGTYDHYSNSQNPVTSTSGSMSWALPYLSFPGSSTDYSLHIADFNGDGLDDILQLRLWPPTGETKYDIMYSRGILNFDVESGIYPGSPTYEDNLVGDYNADGQADILATINGGYTIISFYENNDRFKVDSIEHAGKILNIDYDVISHDPNYDPNTPINGGALTNHYLTKTLPVKVVKHLNDGIDLSNTYNYGGLIYHKYGLGLRGFETFQVENGAGEKTTNEFVLTTQIPYLKETRILDGTSCGTYLGTQRYYAKRIEYYQLDNNGGANGRSRIIHHYPQLTHDFINGDLISRGIATGSTGPGSVYYEYGQAASMHTASLGAVAWSKTTQYTYDLNAPFINKGKAVIIVEGPTNDLTDYGRTTVLHYDAQTGVLLVDTTDPGTFNQAITTYNYDNTYGNLIETSTTAIGVVGNIVNKTSYTTDGRFVASTENAMGYTTSNNYGNLATSWGRVWKHKGINNLETEYTYDVINRVINTKDIATGVEVATSYAWADGSPFAIGLAQPHLLTASVTVGLSTDVTTVYNKYNRVVREARNNGNMVYKDYTYNSRGLLESATSPYPANMIQDAVISSFDYDCFGREVQRSVSDGGATIQTSYQNNYVTGTSIDMYSIQTNQATGKVIKTKYGPSFVASIEDLSDPDVETILYEYYSTGALKKVTTNGNVTTYDIDAFNRTKSKTEPNAGTSVYAYSALDRLIRERLTNGTTYEYTYDKLGRVVTKNEVGQAPYVYTYNNTNGQPSTGMLTEITAPNGSFKRFTHNSLGEVIKVEEGPDVPNTFTTEYTYDVYGRTTSHTYPSGDVIGYQYAPTGLLEKVSLNNSPLGMSLGLMPQDLWSVQMRDNLDRITITNNYNYLNAPVYESSFSYNKHSYLTGQSATASGNTIADMTYSFNVATGNLSHRTDNTRGFTEFFSYDLPNDRLTHVTYAGAWATNLDMDYDIHGNILKKSDVSTSTYDWKYDKYALTQVPEPQTSSPSYEIPMNTQDVEYTSFMKVKKIREDQANEILIYYGADDERVKADYYELPMVNHLKTKYYATNYEKIVDAATGDVEHICYIWGAEKPVAITRHKVAANPANSTSSINHILTDYQGSITHILDNDGMFPSTGVLEERSYDAWGRVRDANTWIPTASNQPPNWIIDRGYTGHEHIYTANWNNNVINMNGRLYDPLVGRMFSPDPVVPDAANSQDYNKYTYARNNPLKYTDPSGNEPITIAAIIIGAVVGGGINVAMHWDDIYKGGRINWGKFGTAFGIGAVAGIVTVATAGAAMPATAGLTASSIGAAGAMTGALGAGSGALVRSYGNHAAFGDPLMTDDQFLMEVAGGAVFNGLSQYAIARIKGIPVKNPPQEPLKQMQTRPMQQISPNAKGQEGLQLNNITQNTERIPSYSGTARYRVPDEMISINGNVTQIGEVKNYSVGRVVNYTNQLRDFIDYANINQIRFQLYIPEGVNVSSPLQNAINQSSYTTIVRY